MSIESIGTIRVALADALRAISGLHVYDYVPEQIVVPAVLVKPSGIEYHQTLGGGSSINECRFRVRVYVQKVSDRAAQDALDSMLAPHGSRSLRAAIEVDTTLGGVVNSTHVVGMVDDSYGFYTVGEIQYSGFELQVEVYA